MDIECIFTFNYSTPRDKLITVLPTALRGIAQMITTVLGSVRCPAAPPFAAHCTTPTPQI
jgi:hypothetical protein